MQSAVAAEVSQILAVVADWQHLLALPLSACYKTSESCNEAALPHHRPPVHLFNDRFQLTKQALKPNLDGF
jgi:hypothetical protein